MSIGAILFSFALLLTIVTGSPPEQITRPAVFTEGMPWAWVFLAVQKYRGNDSVIACNFFGLIT